MGRTEGGTEGRTDDVHAALQRSGSLVDDAVNEELTAARCDLEYWIADTTRRHAGLEHGHEPGLKVPDHMLRPGPLRDAAADEFAFRALSEDIATRNISWLTMYASSVDTLEFYTTQLFDEARHAHMFRWHLVELGFPRERIAAVIDEIVGDRRARIIRPLEEFADEVGRAGDFIGGVILLTVVGEGALAPAAEMSMRKWEVLDPPAGQIGRSANLDEIRHLAVGTNVVREHVGEHPEDRARLMELIERGMKLWQALDLQDLLSHRERLFQEGMEPLADLIGGYELVPGRPLIETTAEERLNLQLQWSVAMQMRRLEAMGLAVG